MAKQDTSARRRAGAARLARPTSPRSGAERRRNRAVAGLYRRWKSLLRKHGEMPCCLPRRRRCLPGRRRCLPGRRRPCGCPANGPNVPKSAAFGRLDAVVPGRSGRRRPATGATGVSARDCRTPASDVSESFDVVWCRRGLARKNDIAPKRLGWEQIGSGGRRSRLGRGPTKVILSSEWRVACRATLSAICADWADPALPGGNLKRTRPRGAENRAKGEAPAVRNGSYLKEQ